MSTAIAIISAFLFAGTSALITKSIKNLIYAPTFKKVKSQWKDFADSFGWKTNLADYPKNFVPLRKIELKTDGFIDQYHIDCTWKKTKLRDNNTGYTTCKIPIKNPTQLQLRLERSLPFNKAGNVTLDDAYFQEKFYLTSNDSDAIAHVLDEGLLLKLRKMFAIEIEAKLTIDTPKKNRQKGPTVLDETVTSFLVYENKDFPMTTKRECLYLQETLYTLIEIAQRLDSLHLNN